MWVPMARQTAPSISAGGDSLRIFAKSGGNTTDTIAASRPLNAQTNTGADNDRVRSAAQQPTAVALQTPLPSTIPRWRRKGDDPILVSGAFGKDTQAAGLRDSEHPRH